MRPTCAPVMPAALRLGLLVAAVLLAAGCGGETGSGPSPSVPTGAPGPANRPVSAVPDPLVATPPAGATAVPAPRVDAAALPAGLPTLVWTRGARTIGVYGRAGGCTAARLDLVEQGPDRVALRVVQFSTGPGPCTRELVYPPLETVLADPLGQRTVVLTGVVS